MEESQISSHVRQEIKGLLDLCEGYVHEDVPMHKMEKGILRSLLKLGKGLLMYIIQQRLERYRATKLLGINGELLERKGETPRKYLSFFGWLEFSRPSYWHKKIGKTYYLDQILQLPSDSSWSYNLQELVGESASENDFIESVRVVNKILDLGLSGKSSARNMTDMGTMAAHYYDKPESGSGAAGQCAPVPPNSCFALSLDGKGVPKIKNKDQADTISKKADLPPTKKRKSSDTPPEPAPDQGVVTMELRHRLGKGEKPNVMQMATVVVCSHFLPKVRNVDQIITGLMYKITGSSKEQKVEKEVDNPSTPTKGGKRHENDNRWHQDIHLRAFLGDQQKAVDYGLQQMAQYVQKHGGSFVIPIDAGIGLEEKITAGLEKYGLSDHFAGIVLDIVHTSEYTWDAATAIFGEKSPNKQPWVEGVLRDLLESKTDKVIKDLKNIVEKGNLSQNKKEQVQKTLTYFTNHQHKMDYKTYLSKGYPVSSALVEAACGHLVKDRMEQSGMRWSSTGAQQVMDTRAVKLNGDMEDFMEFKIAQEQVQRLKAVA